MDFFIVAIVLVGIILLTDWTSTTNDNGETEGDWKATGLWASLTILWLGVSVSFLYWTMGW